MKLVSWDENFGVCYAGTKFCGLQIGGKNNGMTNIKFTSAQMIATNGDVVDLKIDIGADGKIPATKARIPPKASFQLWIEFPPPYLDAAEFLAKWGRAHLNTEYQGVKFSREFDEEKMREMLGPRAFDPHPTRDKDDN